MIDIDAARSRLEHNLAELRARQAHVVRDLAEPLSADSSEQAVELEDDASLERQAALIGGEIESVRRALERIGKGSYGQCVRCGGEIAPARLEARPESALCIDCARAET
jgi:RNA polymerase-binding transcription factor DksA